MGKSSGGGGEDNPYAEVAANIAQQIFEETTPMRQNIVGRGEQFLEGDFDPTASPIYNPMRKGVEGQYNVARENVISSLPQGGGLQQGLADVETGRADALSAVTGQIAQNEYNKIFGYATGTPIQSISGLNQAGGIVANQLAAEDQGKGAATGGLMQGLGMLGYGWLTGGR
jgi:hypothetical protein